MDKIIFFFSTIAETTTISQIVRGIAQYPFFYIDNIAQDKIFRNKSFILFILLNRRTRKKIAIPVYCGTYLRHITSLGFAQFLIRKEKWISKINNNVFYFICPSYCTWTSHCYSCRNAHLFRKYM